MITRLALVTVFAATACGREPAPGSTAEPAPGVTPPSAPTGSPPSAPAAAGPVGTITVVAATYGANCKAPHGNVTQHLASACNGKPACEYKVDYTVIGDPAVGCSKEYLAEWHCGAPSDVRRATAPGEAGYGKTVMLTCAAP